MSSPDSDSAGDESHREQFVASNQQAVDPQRRVLGIARPGVSTPGVTCATRTCFTNFRLSVLRGHLPAIDEGPHGSRPALVVGDGPANVALALGLGVS
jgi:hypothetical protein